jgi:hypothetical protein
MRQPLAPLLAALAALSAGACSSQSTLYQDAAASAELHEISVYAADRLEIDHRKIILADAETPQPAPRASCRAEEMIAAQAAEVVRSTLTAAHHIEVQPAGDGAALVNVDGLDLGQTLIRQNLAVARRRAAMDWCFRLARRD